MRTGWGTKSLGDIAVVGAGNSAPQDKALFAGGRYPFFRTSDVGRIHVGTLTKSEDRLNDKGIKRLTLHPAGTILIPKSGASTFLDHRVIMGVDGYVSSHLATVRARPDIIDTKYLFYYLLTVEARSLGVDTSYPTLSLSQVSAINVSLPPLPEQQRIVAVLEAAFTGLATATANVEKNLAHARELFEIYLNSVFTQQEGWAEKSLRDISIEFGRGKSKHRPRNDPTLYGGKYPFIQTGDIRNAGGVIVEYSQTYNEKGLAQSRLWPKGAICITIAANIAETGILGFDACFPDSVIGMVVDPAQTNNKFVEYLLRFFKTTLQAQGKGSAQDNINLATFENRKFPFPPVKAQNQLAVRLDMVAEEVRRLVSSYGARLQRISELKQSILQKAFSGELTPPPSQAIKEAAE